jgi:RoxA-like, cytochrome c-like
MFRKMAITLIGIIVVIAAFVYVPRAWQGLQQTLNGLHVALPVYAPTQKTVWLDQNWTGDQRKWFYHADQGTLTFGIPYEWFVALERPISLPNIFAECGRLADPAYLDRFGFIPGAAEPNAVALPVGLARGGPMLKATGEPWPNPRTRERMTGIGLTCAACHTGRFTYQNTAVIVDGGPALTNLLKLKEAIGLSLFWTQRLPWRFSRFAARVLGPNASSDEAAALKAQLDEVLGQYSTSRNLEEKVATQSIEEGYGRLDALNRIGNQVFSLDLNNPNNYAGSSAPVHYPRIWDAPWFDWVQYNAAIEQPMVRNAGEALGVGATLNLTDPSKGWYASGVPVNTLVEIEKQIAGNQPNAESGFSGLRSPQWPKDILPPIDPALAAEGAKLYALRCEGCHLPPVKSKAFFESPRWLPPNQAGERYLHVKPIDIKEIGTDPAQAEDMKNRTVAIPANLGITSSEFGPALGQLVEKTVNYWYDRQQPPISDADRNRMNGNRGNGIQALLAYKVRPLDGIWATPPYLHNGSVPNIYALLSPVSERPAKFWLGNREYDPVNVGYRFDKIAGGFEFDTSVRGNHNTGHEFNDGKGDGIIGPKLTPDERRALVEYIKTL